MTEAKKKHWWLRIVIILLAYAAGFLAAFWLHGAFYRWLTAPLQGSVHVIGPRQSIGVPFKFAHGIGFLLATIVFASFLGPRGRRPFLWAGAYLLAGCAASGIAALSIRASYTAGGPPKTLDTLPNWSVGVTGAVTVLALAFLHRQCCQDTETNSKLPT